MTLGFVKAFDLAISIHAATLEQTLPRHGVGIHWLAENGSYEILPELYTQQ